MSCTVRFNEFNNVEEVLTKDGNKSILNDKLNKSVLIGNKNQAWDIQKNAFSPQVEKMYSGVTDPNYTYESGEPKMFYKMSNEVSEDLETVLLNNPGIDTIEMGFKNPKTDSFVKLASIDNIEGANNMQSYAVDQIRKGQLQAEKVEVNGEYLFKGKTDLTNLSVYNAHLAVDDATLLVDGKLPVVNNDGTFKLESNKGLHVGYVDGVAEVIPTENLEEALQQKAYDNKEELWLMAQIQNDFGAKPTAPRKPTVKKSEQELVSALTNLLKKLGFTTTTIENYRKNVNDRLKKDPSLKALADVTRKVVAFANGEYTTDNLTEEVAHIIIELYKDQNSVTTLLAEVVNHPEYQEFAEYYRAKYQEHFPDESNVEIEDRVRREVLGKILQRKIQDSFSVEEATPQETSLIDKLRNVFTDFITRIQKYFRPHHISEFDKIMDDMVNSLTDETLDKFTEEELPYKDRIFFSSAPTDLKVLKASLRELYIQLDRNLRAAFQGKEGVYMPLVENLEAEMELIDQLTHATDLGGIMDGSVKEVSQALDQLQGDDTLNTENRIRGQVVLAAKTQVTAFINHLENIKKTVDVKNRDKVDLLLTKFRKLQSDIALTEGRLQAESDRFVDKLLRRMIRALDVKDKTKDELEQMLGKPMKDIGILARIFGLASNSKNIYIAALSRKAFEITMEARGRTQQRANPYINKYADAKYRGFQSTIIKRDKNGNVTHFIESIVDEAQALEDLKNFRAEKLAEVAGISVEDAKKALKEGKEENIKGITSEKLKEVEDAVQEYGVEQREQVLDEEYVKARDARHERAGLTTETTDYLKHRSYQRRRSTEKARRQDGRLDKSLLSPHDLGELHRVEQRHKSRMSPVDTAGNMKEGLYQKKMSEMTDADFDSLGFNQKDTEAIKNLLADPRTRKQYENRNITLKEGGATLTGESIIAFELQKLNLITAIDIAGGQLEFNYDQALREELEADHIKNHYQWAYLNGNFAFSDEYYSQMDGSTSYVQAAEAMMDTFETDDEREVQRNNIERYKDLTTSRRELLKQNRQSGSPIEINYDDMPLDTREAIKRLDNEIAKVRRSIKIDQEAFEGEGMNLERDFTEDFYKMAQAEGLSVLDYAERHMPIEKKENLYEYRKALRKFFAQGAMGEITNIGLSRVIQQAQESGALSGELFQTLTQGGMTNSEAFTEIVLREYAKTSVYSYFKTTAPQGYKNMIKEFQENPELVKEFILDRESAVNNSNYSNLPLQYLQYNPGFTWREGALEEGTKNENKFYDKNGGKVQPKLFDKNGNPKYIDTKFFDKYGINLDQWRQNPIFDYDELSKMVTRNKDEFEFLKETRKMHQATIDAYGDTGVISPNLRQQIRKQDLEKMMSYTKRGAMVNMKDALTDMVSNKRDEMLYGEVIEDKHLKDADGNSVVSTIQVVPKYYQSLMEDPATISESTMASAVIAYHQAEIYKSRMEKKAEMEAIADFIERQTYIESSGSRAFRKGKASNSSLMAREYLNYALYGVRENTKVEIMGIDVASTVRTVTKAIGNLNLKYNPVVDATSLTTGALFTKIESVVGEHIDRNSFVKGEKILWSMLPKYVSESGKIDKTSDLHKLLERFNVDDIEDRVSQSKYARAGRLLNKSGYGMSKLANLPVTPKVLLGVINDYRVYNGEIITFRNFLEIKKAEAAENGTKYDRSATKQQWKNLGNDTFYQMLDMSGETLTYNSKFEEFVQGKVKEELELLRDPETPNNPKEEERLRSILADPTGEAMKNEVEARFTQQLNTVGSKAKTIMSRVDGVMDQTDQIMLQRHFLGSLVMLHKGWLFINLGNRFKERHVNFRTNNIEEGHWRSIFRTMKSYTQLLREYKSPAKAYAALREESTYEEYKNFKRFWTEMAVLAAFIAGGLLLMADDDDDDTTLTTAFKFLYMRTFAEFNSTSLYGFKGLIFEQIKDPVVISRQAQSALSGTYDLVTGDFKDAWGEYRKLLLPVKRYDKLTDLQGYYQDYLHFNQDNIPKIVYDESAKKEE